MSETIALPEQMIKKLNPDDLPCQWFAQVWILMNENKLTLSDEIIQEIFIARGKGREAQIEFYNKHGVAEQDEIEEQEIQEDDVERYYYYSGLDLRIMKIRAKARERTEAIRGVLRFAVWVLLGMVVLAIVSVVGI